MTPRALVGTAGTILVGAAVAGYVLVSPPKPVDNTNQPQANYAAPAKAAQCDESLWNHVYPGDTRRFKTAKDRLKVIQECVTVTGTLVDIKHQPDGDSHLRL